MFHLQKVIGGGALIEISIIYTFFFALPKSRAIGFETLLPPDHIAYYDTSARDCAYILSLLAAAILLVNSQHLISVITIRIQVPRTSFNFLLPTVMIVFHLK